jgi:cysteinyl-tRNA synthetase
VCTGLAFLFAGSLAAQPKNEESSQPGLSERSVLLDAVKAERLQRINGAHSWGYQLSDIKLEELVHAPYDLLVVDATTGLATGRRFGSSEVDRLKRKPDGVRRLVVSYLSVGEAEDYRPEYFAKEYMEEDAPDWLMHENKDWKGNRIIAFCSEGWQQTVLGDEMGRSVYDSLDPSPLYRVLELGFDGVFLDRVDVYQDVGKRCPDAERRMVDFVVRLAAHARKKNPHFMVIVQNAEELLKHRRMIEAIDAVAKESLFHSWGRTPSANNQDTVANSIRFLTLAKQAGRPVFVIDYARSRAAAESSRRKIEQLGFIPYIGPKALDALWLPGRNF